MPPDHGCDGETVSPSPESNSQTSAVLLCLVVPGISPEIASSNRKAPTAVVARAAAKPLHHNVLATALATKLAWIVSTVLAHGRSYEARASRREQRKRLGSTSECPDIPDCNCVGKHRAAAIELELVEKRDHGKRMGPGQAYSDNEISECEVIEA